MTTLMMFVFLAGFGAVKAYVKLSAEELELFCAANGVYIARKDTSRNAQCTATYRPIFAPRLSDRPLLQFIETINGIEVRNEILFPHQVDSTTFSMVPFNNTKARERKNGDSDLQDFRALTMDQIKELPNGTIIFERVEPFLFAISWPNSKRAAKDGDREVFGGTVGCNTNTIIYPAGSKETQSRLPYSFHRHGKKFPVENAPSDFCPCATANE